MMSGANLAEVAALVGDPARANMLAALMDGQALTAGELAYLAHVTPPTASAHLAKLVAAGLLAVLPQGRHRYFRLASPVVARMLEGISLVGAERSPARFRPPSARDEALCLARTCYDHLAGWLGVAIADSLTAHGHVLIEEDGGEVTPSGIAFLQELGIDLPPRRRRVFCRPCLDWSERRPHLAGAVGAAIAARLLEAGWLERMRDTRAVAITVPGRRRLKEVFGIELPAARGAARAPLPAAGERGAARARAPMR